VLAVLWGIIQPRAKLANMATIFESCTHTFVQVHKRSYHKMRA